MQSFKDEYGPKDDTEISAHKDKVLSVSRSYRLDTRFRIRLERENILTRILKFVGLAKEFQTGDGVFDDFFYVVSDDPVTCRNLAGNSVLIEQMTALVATLDVLDWRFASFESDGTYLTLLLKPGHAMHVENVDKKQLNAHLDVHMLPVKALLERPELTSMPEPREEVTRLITNTSLFLLGLGSVLALYIVMTVFYTPDYWYLDFWNFFYGIGIASAWIVSAFLLLVFWLYRGTSRLYRMVLAPTGAVFLSTFTLLFVSVRFSNVYLDHSTPQRVSCTIYEKDYRAGGRRSPERFILSVSHPFQADRRTSIDVHRGFFQDVGTGDTLVLWLKRGFWHYTWIYGIERSKSNAPQSAGAVFSSGSFSFGIE